MNSNVIEKIQALMDEVYTEWQKEENKDKGKWDVLDSFSEAHKIAVAFGNFNYQVENGGIDQWIYNGYFYDDAEKFTEYLEIGAETDERCRTILDKVYELDQYARETECDRAGYYSKPYDEDGEHRFIGDMIDGDEFDSWYYEQCGKEDWWEVVGGIIEKVEPQELAQIGQDEHGESEDDIKPVLRVYIENIVNENIGGFIMPLPATREEIQAFLEEAEITGWRDMQIKEVSSEIPNLAKRITDAIETSWHPEIFDEINYLAARIEPLRDEIGAADDVFVAALDSNRYNGSVAEIINLTYISNLNRFDLYPAMTNADYGDFLIEQVESDTNAEAFNRLEKSDDPEDRALAKYVEKLEKYADREAYGRDAIKEENGVLTNRGLLMGGDGMQSMYRGTQDIPDKYRVYEPVAADSRAEPEQIADPDWAVCVEYCYTGENGERLYETVEYPTSKEQIDQLRENAGFDGENERVFFIESIETVIPGLEAMLPEELSFNELNYLSANIMEMESEAREIFAACIEATKPYGDMAQIINISLGENLGAMYLQPAFSAEQYGDFLVNSLYADDYADIFYRLEQSEDSTERAFAAHFTKLETNVDKEAYGLAVAREENGVFTKHGYLTGCDNLRELYKNEADIPEEFTVYRASSPAPEARDDFSERTESGEKQSVLAEIAEHRESQRKNSDNMKQPEHGERNKTKNKQEEL